MNIDWQDRNIVPKVSKILEKDNWEIISQRTQSYPTESDQIVYPDIVAIRKKYALFAEVKTLLFRMRYLDKLHILYDSPEKR